MAIDVTSQEARSEYTGNGATTAFTFPFVFFNDGDLKVYVAGVLKTLTTDYTVTGAGVAGGGTVTFLAAPANGAAIVIVRDTAIQNTTHFSVGRLNTETLNLVLNTLFTIAQEIDLKLDRTVRLADSDTTDGLTLPDATTRASKFLGFDGTGALAALAGTTGVSVSVAMQAVVAAATVATALELLGFKSSDASAAEGPTIPLFRDSASPAASDIMGAIRFDGRSSTAVQRAYAKILALLVDPTNAAEVGQLEFYTMAAGALARRVAIKQGLIVGSPTGGDKGVGTLNLVDLYFSNLQATKIFGMQWTPITGTGGGSTTIPFDDTVPQLTEGDQFLTASYTPKSATSTLIVLALANVSYSVAATMTAALFKDADAAAMAASSMYQDSSTSSDLLTILHSFVAGTTSAISFKVRVGGSTAGTSSFNGTSSARKLGGVMTSGILVIEVGA